MRSPAFSVRASGQGTLRYQWQRDGANIAGATAQDYTIASVVAGDNGARFRAVVSEADLEHLEEAPGFERQRWTPALARAVLERYRLDRHEGPLWIYVPR